MADISIMSYNIWLDLLWISNEI